MSARSSLFASVRDAALTLGQSERTATRTVALFDLTPEKASEARRQGAISYTSADQREAKQTGERSAGNPHAAFDEAGAGNVARPRWWDTRRRKSEPTGNTNFGLNRRASPRDPTEELFHA